jgi:hypothetical protein
MKDPMQHPWWNNEGDQICFVTEERRITGKFVGIVTMEGLGINMLFAVVRYSNSGSITTEYINMNHIISVQEKN